MKVIQWLVSLVPKQARSLVAIMLIAISTLSGTIVYLYKDNKLSEEHYNRSISQLSEYYQKRTDSLTKLILDEKERSKQEVVSRLEEIIKEQKNTIHIQDHHKGTQRNVISINNTIIQKNEQRIKQLKNE